MSIDKLPSGSYRLRKMVKGQTYSVTFDHKPTKREIDQAIAEAITKAPPIKKTFSMAFEAYLDSKSNVLSPSTIRGYRKDFRMLSEDFVSMPLSSIDQLTLQAETNRIAEKHSPHTVRNVHGLVSAVLRQFNPQMVINTTLPKKWHTEPYTPSDEDIRRILEHLEGDSIYIAVALGCYGLRRSEIFALTADDIIDDCVHITKAKVKDENNNWVVKPMTKTEASFRKVYISHELAELIKEQGFVYLGSETALNRHLHVAQDYLDIPRFSFHKLRHYFASRMSTMTDDSTVMALGGWSSDYVMKQVYRHSMAEEEKKKELAQKLWSKVN